MKQKNKTENIDFRSVRLNEKNQQFQFLCATIMDLRNDLK